jgi:hypothetical protein
VAVIVSGTLGEEGHAHTEDDGPDVSDSQGDAPRSSISALFSSEVDAVGNEDSESDEKLVSTGECQSLKSVKSRDERT